MMAENRSAKAKRARKWATDETGGKLFPWREHTCGCTMTSNQMKICILRAKI